MEVENPALFKALKMTSYVLYHISIKLQLNIETEILPTAGYSIEKVSIPQVSKPVTVIDCSGLGRHRDNWRVFYPDCEGVIFVIDATDAKRLSVVKNVIHEFLEDPCNFFCNSVNPLSD